MIQRIIINNGKRYLVNCISYNDYVPDIGGGGYTDTTGSIGNIIYDIIGNIIYDINGQPIQGF